MNTSEVLNQAADTIERRGWSQGTGWYPKPGETTPVCAEGAIRLCGDFAEVAAARDALAAYLYDRYPECINPLLDEVVPFGWNDRPRRTAEEVVEVLRAAAVIEAARESQAAVVSA